MPAHEARAPTARAAPFHALISNAWREHDDQEDDDARPGSCPRRRLA
jgi:hypothetical protein